MLASFTTDKMALTESSGVRGPVQSGAYAINFAPISAACSDAFCPWFTMKELACALSGKIRQAPTVGRPFRINHARRDAHEKNALLAVLSIELGNCSIACCLADRVRCGVMDCELGNEVVVCHAS